MEQGSNIIEEEATEMMNVVEVARMTECLKALGFVQNYIATGVGLPTREPAAKESD